MENSKFWIGLGIGSVAGALVYRFSRTGKGRRLKRKMCHAWHHMGDQAGELFETAKEKVWNVGTEAAEKAADKADELKEKMNDVKDKAYAFAADAKK